MAIVRTPIEICPMYPEINPQEFDSHSALGQKLSINRPVTEAQADVLYNAVRYLLVTRFQQELPFDRKHFSIRVDSLDVDTRALGLLVVFGRLVNQRVVDPHEGRGGNHSPDDVVVDWTGIAGAPGRSGDRIAPRFITTVNEAFSTFSARLELHAAVFRILLQQGVPERMGVPVGADGHPVSIVYGAQTAAVVDHLVRSGKSVGDPLLGLYVSSALSTTDPVAGAPLGGSGPLSGGSSISVELLDLEEAGSAATILQANVQALSFLYQAAILEEQKVPQVVERIVSQWVEGTTPISTGVGPDLLYQFFRTTQDRLTEVERRSLFARAFGLAQGSVEVELPNREFQDLWIRFLASVSGYVREVQASANIRRTVLPEHVFKSARDLGSNLSLHGYGMVHFAAVELQNSYQFFFKVLDSDDIQQAYGVRDRWQLIERVSQMYLGGAVNGVKLRTMAQAGGSIIRWLADSSAILSGASAPANFKDYVVNPFPAGRKSNLASETERWLAVTGTNDQTVTQYAEPVSLNTQATLPTLSLGANLEQMKQMVRALPNGTLPQA